MNRYDKERLVNFLAFIATIVIIFGIIYLVQLENHHATVDYEKARRAVAERKYR